MGRTTKFWIAFAALAMLVAGTFSDAQAKDPVKIGILHSLSGTMAISEVSLRDAVLMAVEHGHKGPLRSLALAIGLTGKMTATEESEAFKQRLTPILAELGDYPHAKLDASNRKKQTTRLIKTECPRCGYTARVARKWLDVGSPICPTDNVQMV